MHSHSQVSLFDTISLTLREVVNPYILLFILFIISLIIFSPLAKRSNGKILINLLVVFGLMSFNSMLMAFQMRQIYIYLLWTYFPLTLFVSPLCYVYIESLVTESYQFSLRKMLHFAVPIIFMFVSLVLNAILIFADLTENFELFESMMNMFIALQGFTLFYIVLIQFILYSIISLKLFYQHKRNIQHYFSYSEGINLNWIAFFIAGMIMYFVIFVLSNNELFFISAIPETAYDIAHFSITLFFIFLIGVHGTKQQNVFELSTLHAGEKTDAVTIEKESQFMKDDELINQIKEQLIQLMENERLYLNSDLTISFLSEKLASNRTYVSYVINECFQQNFYTFVNTYRIQEAINKLQNPEFKNYSIEGIANLCGFSSRSSFNNAFKKITGKTPSEFKI